MTRAKCPPERPNLAKMIYLNQHVSRETYMSKTAPHVENYVPRGTLSVISHPKCFTWNVCYPPTCKNTSALGSRYPNQIGPAPFRMLRSQNLRVIHTEPHHQFPRRVQLSPAKLKKRVWATYRPRSHNVQLGPKVIFHSP